MSIIDANLPIFHFLPNKDTPHEVTIAHSQFNSLPVPKYLKRRDTTLSDGYLATLHDAYYPDIIYASVQTSAIYPQPPQPTPEETRKRNAARQRALSNPNSVTPKEVELAFREPAQPAPLVPSQVTLYLYNPDSSVILTQKPSSWNSGPYFEYSLPKINFMQPTGSKLDSDYGAQRAHLATYPMATFRWRKEGGVLSRASLRCSYVSETNALLHDDGGRPPDGSNGKRKVSAGGGRPDPDITVAIFTNGIGGGKQQGKGEVTIYESNMRRVEVDDIKGLELVLVMSAAVIGEIWFGDMKSVFNLSGKAPSVPSGPGRVATISVQQQQEMNMAASPRTRRGTTSSPTEGDTSGNADGDVLPAYDGPQNGAYPQEKVRPTQEELHNRAAEAHRMRTDRQYQAMMLAQQEAEARRLQEEFEREAREEQRRKEEEIERETERLRLEFEQEESELRRQHRRSLQAALRVETNVPGVGRPVEAPIPVVPSIELPQPTQGQHAHKTSWFGTHAPDKTKPLLGEKSKRKSFMGLRTGFMGGGGSNGGEEGKNKVKVKAESVSPPSSSWVNGGAGPYGGLVVPGATESGANGKLSKKGRLGKKGRLW